MLYTLVPEPFRVDPYPMINDFHHGLLDIPRRLDQGKVPDYHTHKHTLYGIQEGMCPGCRVMFPFRNMTVDHVVP